MSHSQLILFLLQIFAMLLFALIFGQLARWLKQPAVFGELLGGIVLGPTVFGVLAPETFRWLFLSAGAANIAREGVTQLGMLFFLFIAGLEVSLGYLRAHKLSVALTSGFGILLPFALGAGLALLLPELLDFPRSPAPLLFAMLMGTALSISALPVIARILMDIGLIRKDSGQIIMASATINDLIGWILFAIILGKFVSPGLPKGGLGIMPLVIASGLLFLIFWIRKKHRWRIWKKWHQNKPGQIMMLITVSILLAAAVVEALGIHSVLGAFLLGVALAEDTGKRNRVHEIIYQFAVSFFAPIYFVSIGLRTDFAANFNLPLLVLAIACIGKIGGASLGARLSGIPPRQALAIGFGLNARGAIEMILASIALQYQLINESIYVALIVMALVTSMISGPAMQRLARTSAPRIH